MGQALIAPFTRRCCYGCKLTTCKQLYACELIALFKQSLEMEVFGHLEGGGMSPKKQHVWTLSSGPRLKVPQTTASLSAAVVG